MKRTTLLFLAIAGALAPTVHDAFAQRVDQYDPALQPITARKVMLVELPDGGCAFSGICAALQSTDGGSMLQSCESLQRELRPGGGQGACLLLLDGAGKLWAGRQSLSSADASFSLDAGL